MRVVRCSIATPPPVIAAQGAAYGSLIGEEGGEEGGVEGGVVGGVVGGSFDGRAAPAEPEPPPELDVEPWSPFASRMWSPPPTAPTIARATEAALRGRLATIGACFTAPAPTGSLRAMLELSPAGELTGARVGGMGDHAIDTCVRSALRGLRVVTPTSEFVELACDLSRGDAQPWRVTPQGSYAVVTATRTGVTYEGKTITPGASEPEPLPVRNATLVIVDPEAPGTIVELALTWAAESDTILLALRAPSGSPAFLGLGRTSVSDTDGPSVDAVDVTLNVSNRLVTACQQTSVDQAKLSDPAAVGALVNRIAARCRKARCPSTIAVALDGGAAARDLVEVLGTLRRAGLERVLIGGTVGCRSKSER